MQQTETQQTTTVQQQPSEQSNGNSQATAPNNNDNLSDDISLDLEQEDFKTMFEESLQNKQMVEGEIVTGKIIQILDDYVMVDIGYKSEGQISIGEFCSQHKKLDIREGDEVDVLLEGIEDDNGLVILSKEKADRMKIWDEISFACENDKLVEGTIISRVKGGLSVDIGVKAFLPGSQVDLRPTRNLDKYLSQTYNFKIIKFNKKRGNIVLSRRALLEKEREELRKETLEKLEKDAILDGIVKNITDYGAFIDLGGIDGLLHITDMSWGRVNHPSEMFSIGDEVKIKVLNYDEEKGRVSLGLKQITPDPWTTAADKYPVHSQIVGRVVSLTDYGAFIELEQGVEGLVHISEMSWTKRVKHPSKLVNINDEVKAMVLDIDAQNRRISLGIKQVEPNPWEELKVKYPVGSIINGSIRNITEFGLFVGIEEGIDGLVHISDITWSQRLKHPSDLFKKGDEVEAVVLNIDADHERFSLGLKQLHSDPWDDANIKYPKGTKIKGKVVKIKEFGVFVELEDGIEGLIHISELSDEKVKSADQVVSEGDEVETLVLQVDTTEQKIALSIKALSRLDSDAGLKEYVEAKSSTTHLGDVFGDKLVNRMKQNEPEKEMQAAKPTEQAEPVPEQEKPEVEAEAEQKTAVDEAASTEETDNSSETGEEKTETTD